MEPEKLVKAWFEPMLEEIKKLEDLLDPSAADPEKRRGYESMPKRVWSKLVTSG